MESAPGALNQLSSPRATCARLERKRPARRPALHPGARSALFLRRKHLATAVLAGLQVDVVRAAKLARFLVLDVGRLVEPIMGTAEAALHARGLVTWNGHLKLRGNYDGRHDGRPFARAYSGFASIWPAAPHILQPSAARSSRRLDRQPCARRCAARCASFPGRAWRRRGSPATAAL